ncbi:hypothetical protein [Georgfuchsia toluolica]|uniref:hypothetical protein n=1 Tax=Georgfuchsia toluolica TaxID=424218 RepID=UPI001C736A13|nr:hypothetical protein [Georgfuchsia toluolica]
MNSVSARDDDGCIVELGEYFRAALDGDDRGAAFPAGAGAPWVGTDQAAGSHARELEILLDHVAAFFEQAVGEPAATS